MIEAGFHSQSGGFPVEMMNIFTAGLKKKPAVIFSV